jgi:RecB family exonuclease
MRLAHSYSSIKLFENCPLRYFYQRVAKSVVDEGGEASKHGERIHAYLEARLKKEADLPQEIATYEPLVKSVEKLGGELYIEHELVLSDLLVPTGWYAPDAWIRSILDILVIKGDEAIVMDWKTGKRKIDFFQLQLFAVQVFKHFPQVQKVKTSLIWLKTMEMDTEQYTRDQSNTMWQDVMGRIRRIEQALEHDNWPAKPSGLCRYCPARHLCDFAKL